MADYLPHNMCPAGQPKAFCCGEPWPYCIGGKGQERKMTINRRGLLTGLVSLVAAPAIVRAASLMPVKRIPLAVNTVFVDGSVDFIGDGSWLRPFQTLQHAIDYVSTLDFGGQTVTVQLASGVYRPAIYRGPASVDIFINGSGAPRLRRQETAIQT